MAVGRKQRRRSKDLPGPALAAIILFLLAVAGRWTYFFVALFVCVVALWLWFLFFRTTTCDVRNVRNGRPCSNNARGYLRACSLARHKQIKRAALTDRLRFRRRTARPRAWGPPAATMAAARQPGTGGTRPAPSVRPDALSRTSYEAVTLTCTVTSTATGLAGLIVALLGSVLR